MKADYSTSPAPAVGHSPSTAGGRRLPKSARARWFAVTACACSLLAGLGFWQLDRAAQKNALAAQIAQRRGLAPLTAATLARTEAAARTQWQRRIALQGQWLTPHTVWLQNRTMDARPGFVVITPLRVTGSDASLGVIAVQRGWVPRDRFDAMKRPPVSTPSGTVQILGSLAPWPARWLELGAAASGPVRQNLDRAVLAAEIGMTVYPSVVVEEASMDNAGDGLARHWPAPTFNVQKNYGYAAQWFALSATLLALYVGLAFGRQRAECPQNTV